MWLNSVVKQDSQLSRCSTNMTLYHSQSFATAFGNNTRCHVKMAANRKHKASNTQRVIDRPRFKVS